MKLKVINSFSWAYRGVDVKAYEAGDEIDTDDQDLIDVSAAEGWTEVAEPAHEFGKGIGEQLSGLMEDGSPSAGRSFPEHGIEAISPDAAAEVKGQAAAPENKDAAKQRSKKA